MVHTAAADPFRIAPETARTPSLHPSKRAFHFQQVRDLSAARYTASLQEIPLFSSPRNPDEPSTETNTSCHQLGPFPGRKVAASGVSRRMEKVGAQKQDVKGCCGTKFLQDAGAPQHLRWACLSLQGAGRCAAP